MAKQTDPEPIETSHLTDADWAELNKLRRTWRAGGEKAVSRAMAELAAANPICWANILAAYFPNEVCEAIKDEMAERGMTEEDLRELIRKLESPAGKQ